MQDLSGRRAFITGAASGIGLGTARALAAAGVHVILSDVRGGPLEVAATALAAAGARVHAIELDVTDRSAWGEVATRVEREYGAVDILCSNAGVNFIGAGQEATFEDWDFCLSVNLGGAINAVRTFVPGMVRRRAGHVVVTSSVAGLYATAGAGCYTTSKFALVGLAESLRADLAGHGVGVSVLCPGPVKSELFESTAAVRPQALAATGSVPVIPPGTSREDTAIYRTALAPEEVGRRVLEGIRRNALYIMTHAEIRPVLEARAAAQLAALPREADDPERRAAMPLLLDPSLYRKPGAQ